MATPPGEFSGHQQRNTIAPPVTPAGTPGHIDPENFEKLRLVYMTGQHEDSTMDRVEGVMEGLLPIDVAEELMPVHPLFFEV